MQVLTGEYSQSKPFAPCEYSQPVRDNLALALVNIGCAGTHSPCEYSQFADSGVVLT
ncbi:hypothetical protein [Bacteriophage sp.]|nr:hypothetical protein [Caudoviricetes sp.]UOF80008.1 hypothetical protein [Bacteriophage sp.]